MSFLENTRRPAGLGGKLMVRMMNVGHRALARWGRGSCCFLRTQRSSTAAAAAGQTSGRC